LGGLSQRNRLNVKIRKKGGSSYKKRRLERTTEHLEPNQEKLKKKKKGDKLRRWDKAKRKERKETSWNTEN